MNGTDRTVLFAAISQLEVAGEEWAAVAVEDLVEAYGHALDTVRRLGGGRRGR